MEQENYDVFISYSRKDVAIADAICEELDKVDIKYFIDRKGISGGQEFIDVIVDSIRNSRIFLFLASENSYTSPITIDEVFEALDGVQEGNCQIVTYIIDDSDLPKDLRFRLRRYNWRTIKEHPVSSVLVPDLLRLLGLDGMLVRRIIKVNEKYGYGDTNGNITIEPKWKSASFFIEGLASVEDFNGKYGYINMKGEVVIPPKWQYAGSFHDGMARVQDEEGKWGFIDKSGMLRVPCVWKDVDGFERGLACVVNADGLFGYIDENGIEVIPCKWAQTWGFHNSELARVKDNKNNWGYIDLKGNVVIPCKWKEAGEFFSDYAKVVRWSGSTIKIDKQGNEVIEVSSRFETGRTRSSDRLFLDLEHFNSENKKTILVAEDKDSDYVLVLVALQRKYRLLRAVNGVDAVVKCDEEKPDLVLMDIHMPEINGLDATRIIKEINPNIPVIAVSAYTIGENINDALAAGCDEFLAKPWRVEDLLDIAAKYVDQ